MKTYARAEKREGFTDLRYRLCHVSLTFVFVLLLPELGNAFLYPTGPLASFTTHVSHQPDFLALDLRIEGLFLFYGHLTVNNFKNKPFCCFAFPLTPTFLYFRVPPSQVTLLIHLVLKATTRHATWGLFVDVSPLKL